MKAFFVLAACLSASSLLSLSCASTGALTDFQPGVLDGIDVASLPPVDDRTPGRMILDEHVVRFDEVDGVVVARELRHTITRIHGPRGQDLRFADVGFDRSFTSVEGFAVRTWDPRGKVHVFGEKEIIEVPMLGSDYLYSDNRVRRVMVPEQPRGGVVEVVSLVRYLEPQMFAFAEKFGSFVDVDVARFAIEHPPGFEIEVLTERGGVVTPWEPVTTTVGGLTRLVWEKKKVAPIEIGDHAPALGDVLDRVTVRLKRAVQKSGAVVEGPKDVQDLSRVTAKMMKDKATVTPAIAALARSVLGDKPLELPKRERAARLYAWTRDSIRYCSIAIGMGGWVPHDASAVEDLRYGDCKDKANLLKSLLSSVDVDSRIVTIKAATAASPFRLPVIAGNFNHAILLVDLDDGGVFVDPTTRTVAFGDLPPFDEDRLCLPADAAGSGLLTTPASSLERDRREARWLLRVDDKGDLRGTVESTHHGFFADDVRSDLLNEQGDDLARAMSRNLGARHLALRDVKVENGAPPVEVTPAVVRADVVDDLRPSGHTELANLFNGPTFLDDGTVSLASTRPRLDVVLAARSDERDEVRLTLPKSVHVRQLPPPAAGESPRLAWSVAWSVEGDELVLRRMLQHKVTRVAAADVAAFQADLDAYRRAFGARVLLNHTAPGPSGSGAASPVTP